MQLYRGGCVFVARVGGWRLELYCTVLCCAVLCWLIDTHELCVGSLLDTRDSRWGISSLHMLHTALDGRMERLP
jgi:hypothetical protein